MKTQQAVVGGFDFGAPAVIADVLKFRVKRGGKIILLVSAEESANNLTFTAQVSPDDSSYSTTTANSNLTAISAITVQRKTTKEYTLVLREGVDLFIKFRASGPGRGQLQVRGDDCLEIMSI